MTLQVRVQGLRWQRGGRRLLDVQSLYVQGPGLVLLSGASGSGKTSLLKALTGTLTDFQGGHSEGRVEYWLDDAPRPIRIGYVPQDPIDGFLGHDPETEFRLRLLAAGWSPATAQTEAQRRVTDLEMTPTTEVPLSHLSGGERKRLALRANLVHEPQLVLLDEPLNQVDPHWRGILLEDILTVASRDLVVLSAHDVDHWLPICREVVVLRDGAVAWQGGANAFAAIRHRFPEIRQRLPPPQPPALPSPAPIRLVGERLTAIKGRPLFRDLDLHLPNGLHAITGRNGSGKTSLLRILSGLERPAEGRVRFDGHDLHALRPRQRAAFTGVHSEQPSRILFLPRVDDEIAFQPRNAGVDKRSTQARVQAAARRFRLQALLGRHPIALSGGEQERVALACLDAAGPQLILMDEPTHGLDGHGWQDLLAFIDRHRAGSCIVMATHDEDLVQRADTVHQIDEGRLVTLRIGTRSPLVEVFPRSRS